MDVLLDSLTREWINALIFHRPVSSGVDGLLRIMGVVHLYGASGIHLYAILNWLEWILEKTGRKFALPAVLVRVLTLGTFLGCALLIWRLQGYSLSLFRPLCSILLRALLRELGFKVWIFAPLLFTLLLEWILSFKTGLSPGAYHYYLAVGGSLLALARRESEGSGLKLHVEMAIYSWIPIAILDLLRDGLVSPFTPILSLLTIPPLTLVLYPLTLLTLALTGGVPAWVFFLWLQGFKGLLILLDLFPLVFSVSWSVGLISGLCLGLLRRFPRRIPLGVVLSLILILLSQSFLIPNSPNRVIQLDVGQGDSALIQEGARAELVDAGPDSPTGAEGWIRRLGRYGVTRLDGVLLTHLDLDHAGGLHSLFSVLPVQCLEISPPHQWTQKGKEMVRWVRSLPGPPEILNSGCIHLSRVAWFQSKRPGAKGNEWMAGIARRITEQEAYFSLGDGDFAQEREFEDRFRNEILSSRYRIWKVGHHGSRFSSDSLFLSKLNAKELWISVGRKNRYHHPSTEAMARIKLSGGEIRRTDREGDLVYRAAGSI